MKFSDQGRAATPIHSQAASGGRTTPRFVNRLCARLESAAPVRSGVSGLLFGTTQGSIIVVQAFRSLIGSDIAAIEAGKESLNTALQNLAEMARRDTDLAPLHVLGWYSFRQS